MTVHALNKFKLGAILVVAAGLAVFHDLTSVPPARLDADLPVTLGVNGRDHLAVRLYPTGSGERLLVRATIDGPIDFGVRGAMPNVNVLRGDSVCVATTGRLARCTFVLGRADRALDLTAIVRSGRTATVSSLEVRSVRSSRAVAGGHRLLWVALLLIPLSILGAWLLRRDRVRSEWLLLATGVTALMAIQPWFTTALLAVLGVAFLIGTRTSTATFGRGKALTGGVMLALGFLLAAKYGKHVLLGMSGDQAFLRIALPLGLSYFAIRLIDSQLRWHRGEQRDVTLREYLAYQFFPSTLAAGPLFTIDQFRVAWHRVSTDDLAAGGGRIVWGVAKKVVIADYLLRTQIFQGFPSPFDAAATNTAGVSSTALASMLVMSFLFAYVDFSAYSDIAIGLGRMYGYRVPENFRLPFLATDLRDFWRRWHITLSQWCMRNLYLPLAIATRTTTFPLLAVMLVIGLWHEFGVAWLLWGVHHGVGLIALVSLQRSRVLPTAVAWQRVGRPFQIAATFGYVAAGHSFVLFSDFRVALAVYARVGIVYAVAIIGPYLAARLALAVFERWRSDRGPFGRLALRDR